jgi:hypothetical protein
MDFTQKNILAKKRVADLTYEELVRELNWTKALRRWTKERKQRYVELTERLTELKKTE